MNEKKKYKLVKLKETFIALGITATMIFTSAVTFGSKPEYLSSSSSTSFGENHSEEEVYVDSDDGYIDVEYSNEKQVSKVIKTNTNINLANIDYSTFVKSLENDNCEFSMEKYYDLENTLILLNNSKYQKKESFELISNGFLDSDKLYSAVINNNNLYMKQDKNSINTFFSEASDSYIREICNLTAEIYNKNKNNYPDIEKVCDTLTHLKIFQNNTSSSNAYVTDDLVFAFNPTMIKMFSDMQDIRGNSTDEVSVEKTVFVHEIEHLFQNASNDFNDENGIEAGFCRRYDEARVNSLWNTWLLEGGAEIKMSESLNTTPKNYDKKISYIRTYNLSRIFEDCYDINDLVNSVFESDLNNVFQILNIKDLNSKKEFLELIYSIEITQGEVKDFWDFYESQEKIKLTSDEKESIRMDIRTEVIKKLSKKYYMGLANGLLNGKIKDLETLFYLMRLWELDCCGHLNFADKQQYKYCKDFIIWQDNVEKSLINAIANSCNMSYDELINQYDNYHMLLEVNGKIINNADFSNLPVEKQEYINASYEKYSMTYFARISTMIDYINSNSKKESIKG